MNFNLATDPFLPVPVLAAFVLVAAMLAIAAVWMRHRGALLRALALATLAAALFNPTIGREDRKPLKDIAVLVVDRSKSQTIANRPAQTTKAVENVRQSLAAIPNLEVRTVTVSSGLNTGHDGTRAFAALKSALADIPPGRFAGAIFITDGQVHDIPAAKDLKIGKHPLHALITGSKKEQDRHVIIQNAPKFAIVGQDQAVRFKVEQHGGKTNGQTAEATISVDGKPVHQVPVPIGQTITLKINIAHGGQNIVEIVVAPLKGELTTQNNRAVTIIKGIRDRLRVLLVSGKPHPGERTWRNLLKADPSVDLVHFTILRPPEKQDGTPINELSLIAFPTRELFQRKLREFDLIIFDRYARRGVLPGLYFYNIADYVNAGGAVLVAAGPDYAGNASIFNSPLSSFLPASPTGNITTVPFRPLLTTTGSRHPVARGLDGAHETKPKWGRWFRLIDTTAVGSVLMEGPDKKPLVVLVRKGKGRVAQILSDQSWLWARGFDGGGPQAEFLRRIAHWLMREPELEEESLTARQVGDKLIITRQTMAEKTEPFEIVSPSGGKQTLTPTKTIPGHFRAELTVTEPGLHRVTNGKKILYAGVGTPDPRETGEVHATAAHLAPLIQKTGGRAAFVETSIPRVTMVKPGRALGGSGWIGLTANGAYDVTAIRTLPLFSTLLALAAVLAILAAMWYREGR